MPLPYTAVSFGQEVLPQETMRRYYVSFGQDLVFLIHNVLEDNQGNWGRIKVNPINALKLSLHL